MDIIDKLHKLADNAFDYTQGDYCNVIMSEKALIELNDYFLNLKQGPKPKSNTLTDVKIHLHGILCSISTYDEVLFFEMKDNMKLNSATEEIFIFTESKEKLQQKEFNVHQVKFFCDDGFDYHSGAFLFEKNNSKGEVSKYEVYQKL